MFYPLAKCLIIVLTKDVPSSEKTSTMAKPSDDSGDKSIRKSKREKKALAGQE
jgi:hypothetical protein